MDNFEYQSTESGLKFTTESVIISEYVTAMNTWHIQENDQVSESRADEFESLHIFYGMGGILIFFVTCMIFYTYFIYLKEKVAEHEIELRRLNERVSQITYRSPPMNEERIFIEDFLEVSINPNATLPQQIFKDCHDVNREYENQGAAQCGNQESRDIRDLHIPFRIPQQNVERKFFPEDFEDLLYAKASPNQLTENSLAVCQKPDKRERILGRMSTPPLCFSSPQESRENIFYHKEFQELGLNTTQIEKFDSLNDKNSYEDATTTPSKITARQSSSPEARSQIALTSPDTVRRRLSTIEGTPRRPS